MTDKWIFLRTPDDRLRFVQAVVQVTVFCLEEENDELETVRSALVTLMLAANEVMLEELESKRERQSHPEVQ
ncbi:MAG: hypothetical protein NZ821_06855 [Gloeomargarita sp. SKYB31]|nr:hypothetical protein [Gloeomargarita sp. SKYB31]